ncbi:hypothetical protein [Legionella rowbothamii]|uniref:hypothetical protein n=1 Tax=Legionella rowbothamii TaxID=96229 RepID=UPI0010542B1D|nr:hypothetical protein [Legionella rowbothamii]
MLSIPEEGRLLVQHINQLTVGKDEQLASSGMEHFLTAAEIEVQGPLLYPCSGSDVVYPILLFPKVNEFILIDEHPLFSANPELNYADLSQLEKIPNLSQGMGFWGYGYDYTNILQTFNRLDVSFNSDPFQNRVGALLLVRLRTLCGMELLQVSKLEDGVYKIVGLCNDELKTIYYVQHHLGHESNPYEWLLAQNIQFQSLFIKAFSVSINDQVIQRSIFQQIKGLYPDNLEQLTVVAEADGIYGFNRTLPHLLNPDCPYFSAETNFAYGYSNKLVLTNGLGLYVEYPEHLLALQQIQNEYIAEQCNEQFIEQQRSEKALQYFLQLDKHKKFDCMQQEGLLGVIDNTLIIKLFDSNNLHSKLTDKAMIEILEVAQEKNLHALQLNLGRAYTNLKHQELVTGFIKRLDALEGKGICSLSINASIDEVNFKSSFAIAAAEALKVHGKNLVEINVRVNDQAALAFIDTFQFLQREGKLAKGIIEPIVSWRTETHQAVVAFFLQNIHHDLQWSA